MELSSVISRGATGTRPAAGIPGQLFYDTTLNKFQRDNGSTWDDCPGSPAGGTGLYSAYLMYQDQKANGVDGGTFTSGAWQTRVLNTEVADTGNHGALASNQITLDAGTYRVQASAPVRSVDLHQLRLQNITDSTTIAYGTNGNVTSSQNVGVPGLLSARFVIAGAKVLELQHRCFTTIATNGFGQAVSFGGTEIYATIELWKEA